MDLDVVRAELAILSPNIKCSVDQRDDTLSVNCGEFIPYTLIEYLQLTDISSLNLNSSTAISNLDILSGIEVETLMIKADLSAVSLEFLNHIPSLKFLRLNQIEGDLVIPDIQFNSLFQIIVQAPQSVKFSPKVLSSNNLKVVAATNSHTVSFPNTLNETSIKSLYFHNVHEIKISQKTASLIPAETLSLVAVEQIPHEFVNFKTLQYLSIQSCHLFDIPSWVYDLVQLRNLDLQNNFIGVIPQELHELENLQVINLNNNRIRSLPPYLSKFKSLQELYLRSNETIFLPSSLFSIRHKFIVESWQLLR